MSTDDKCCISTAHIHSQECTVPIVTIASATVKITSGIHHIYCLTNSLSTRHNNRHITAWSFSLPGSLILLIMQVNETRWHTTSQIIQTILPGWADWVTKPRGDSFCTRERKMQTRKLAQNCPHKKGISTNSEGQLAMVYQASYFLDTQFIKPIETCFQGLFHLYFPARCICKCTILPSVRRHKAQ